MSDGNSQRVNLQYCMNNHLLQIQSVDNLMRFIFNASTSSTSDIFCILYLPAPPVFIQEPSDVSMEIGSNVTLPCYVQGYPEPKIKWRRLDNVPVFSRPFSVSSASQLRTGALFISSRLKDVCVCACVLHACVFVHWFIHTILYVFSHSSLFVFLL